MMSKGVDLREVGGYDRVELEVVFEDGGRAPALTYVATADNRNFLGHAPLEEIAAQVRSARGPSGDNVEYVLKLAESLREIGADDDHVFALARMLES